MKDKHPQEEPDRRSGWGRMRMDEWEKEPGDFPRNIPVRTEGALSVSVPQGLKVVLTQDAFSQLFGYAYATALEISCLGTVVQEAETFKITAFHLLGQTGSGAHTCLKPEAIAELAESLLSEGKGSQARAIRAWAHSHPDLGLFWSPTDETTCRTLASDYLISLVVGGDFSVRCRIDLAGPVPLTIDHVPVFCEAGADEGVLAACRKEVAEKLSPRVLLGPLSRNAHDKERPSFADDLWEDCSGRHLGDGCPVGMDRYTEFEDWPYPDETLDCPGLTEEGMDSHLKEENHGRPDT